MTVSAKMPRVAALSTPVDHGLSLPVGLSREICKICYRPNRVGFYVPTKVWRKVIPKHLVNKVVCLDCFTRMADEKLIKWDDDMEFAPVSFVTHLQPLP